MFHNDFLGRLAFYDIDIVQLRGLTYIKTFTIAEFKEIFGLRKVNICQTSKQFCYFCFRDAKGFVAENQVPMRPRISVAVGYRGELHYILHEAENQPQEILIKLRPENLQAKRSSWRVTRYAVMDADTKKIYTTDSELNRIEAWVEKDSFVHFDRD